MTDADTITAALDEHGRQVYEATRALQAAVAGPDLVPWADLTQHQHRQYLRDIADAMTDVHAATLTVGRQA